MKTFGEVISAILFFVVCFFLIFSVICHLRRPDEDEVIKELIKLEIVEQSIVNDKIQDKLVDEKFRPLLLLWSKKECGEMAYTITMNGNVIEH
jgi:hypothetical protein